MMITINKVTYKFPALRSLTFPMSLWAAVHVAWNTPLRSVRSKLWPPKKSLWAYTTPPSPTCTSSHTDERQAETTLAYNIACMKIKGHAWVPAWGWPVVSLCDRSRSRPGTATGLALRCRLLLQEWQFFSTTVGGDWVQTRSRDRPADWRGSGRGHKLTWCD